MPSSSACPIPGCTLSSQVWETLGTSEKEWHVRTTHLGVKVKCLECPALFSGTLQGGLISAVHEANSHMGSAHPTSTRRISDRVHISSLSRGCPVSDPKVCGWVGDEEQSKEHVKCMHPGVPFPDFKGEEEQDVRVHKSAGFLVGCPYCSAQLCCTSKSLINHIQRAHGHTVPRVTAYKLNEAVLCVSRCPVSGCPEYFPSPAACRTHISKAHRALSESSFDVNLRCPTCVSEGREKVKVFRTRRALCKHMAREHPGKKRVTHNPYESETLSPIQFGVASGDTIVVSNSVRCNDPEWLCELVDSGWKGDWPDITMRNLAAALVPANPLPVGIRDPIGPRAAPVATPLPHVASSMVSSPPVGSLRFPSGDELSVPVKEGEPLVPKLTATTASVPPMVGSTTHRGATMGPSVGGMMLGHPHQHPLDFSRMYKFSGGVFTGHPPPAAPSHREYHMAHHHHQGLLPGIMDLPTASGRDGGLLSLSVAGVAGGGKSNSSTLYDELFSGVHGGAGTAAPMGGNKLLMHGLPGQEHFHALNSGRYYPHSHEVSAHQQYVYPGWMAGVPVASSGQMHTPSTQFGQQAGPSALPPHHHHHHHHPTLAATVASAPVPVPDMNPGCGVDVGERSGPSPLLAALATTTAHPKAPFSTEEYLRLTGGDIHTDLLPLSLQGLPPSAKRDVHPGM